MNEQASRPSGVFPSYLSAEDIAERWPVAGDSLSRWRDQLRRWRSGSEPLLCLWRDYTFETNGVTPGRYAYVYRTKRIVYLLLKEDTVITAEIRQDRLADLRTVYTSLLQTEGVTA